jgi:L-alanine-DL-glutamate epimerase-like enolase superfamily enzyme
MKITGVEPMVLRSGPIDVNRPDGTQDAFLVLVHTDEGIVGIGEADTSPYVAETIVTMPSSHSVSRGLAEVLVGEDPLSISRLWDAMFQGAYHYGRDGAALHAISAIDLALWDIAGKAAGVPVSELLGGRRSDHLEVYASEVMPETAEQVSELATRAVGDGFSAMKLGWGPLGTDLGRDVELVSTAREVLGANRRLMIDGGMAYSVKAARQFCEKSEGLSLSWFEEPFRADDMVSYRRLSDAVTTRIACGEAVSTLPAFKRLVDEGRVDVLQPDLGRCGGITVARDVSRLSIASNVDLVPHCFSTDVLLAACLQFVAALPDGKLCEFPVTPTVRSNSVVTDPFRPKDGVLEVPSSPGLGIELDWDEIGRRRVSRGSAVR